MPRKKQVEIELPSELTKSPVYRKQTIRPDQLPGYVEKILALYTPSHLKAAMDVLYKKAKEDHDMTAVKIILQIHNLLPQSGVSITTNILNRSGSEPVGIGAYTNFDAIVRRLESLDQSRSGTGKVSGPALVETRAIEAGKDGED